MGFQIRQVSIYKILIIKRIVGKFSLFSGPTANYYQTYNFEKEPWWPKFDALRSKYGIVIAKGDKTHQSQTRPKASHVSRVVAPNTQPTSTQKNVNQEQSQPSYENIAPERNEQSQMMANILQGQNMLKKTQPNGTGASTAPPARPPVKQRKPMKELAYPKSKALYPYSAADGDELSFEEGDIIYIVREGEMIPNFS